MNYFASLDVEEEAPAKVVAAPKAAAAGKSAPTSGEAKPTVAGEDGPARCVKGRSSRQLRQACARSRSRALRR